jgi:GTPase
LVFSTLLDYVSAIKIEKSKTKIISMAFNSTVFNLNLLRTLLNLLPVRNDYTQFVNQPVELLVDGTYSVVGHSTIVSGLLKSGTIKVNDLLAIGPYLDSTYKQVKVRSIHCKYKNLSEAKAGSYICLSLKNITRKDIKKGMVIISDIQNNKLAVSSFNALIHILHSPTTIKLGYQPFIHIDNIRQAVRIIEINKQDDDDSEKILRTGDKAKAKLQFLIKPEYVKVGMKLIFREGKIRALGKIIE